MDCVFRLTNLPSPPIASGPDAIAARLPNDASSLIRSPPRPHLHFFLALHSQQIKPPSSAHPTEFLAIFFVASRLVWTHCFCRGGSLHFLSGPERLWLISSRAIVAIGCAWVLFVCEVRPEHRPPTGKCLA